MTLNIVEEIAKSIENRKKKKQEIDSTINLSEKNDVKFKFSSDYSTYDGETPIRLLDEGAILYEDGSIRDFIMKGSIERFYNSLSDDFVGYINLGHIDNWSLPLNLGTWTKSDLSIVDIGDGRKGLDCKPHINKELYIVKDLMSQEIPLSVSVEMYCDFDWDKTDSFGFNCVKDINIVGFSIVGNPANVSSSGIELSSEVNDMDLEKIKNFLLGEIDSEEDVEAKLSNDEAEEVTESTEEDKVEATSEETIEEQKEELNEESEEEKKPNNAFDTLMSHCEDLQNEVADLRKTKEKYNDLKTENEELKQEIVELKNKLNESKEKAELSEQRVDKVLGQIEKLMSPTEKTQKQTKNGMPWGSLD